MDVLNTNGQTLLNKRDNKRDEMNDALMRVMTKIFSAKVVLERLPDSYEDKGVTVKEEILELDDLNCRVKEEIIEQDEPDYDESSEQTIGIQRRKPSHMVTRVCPKCGDKCKGGVSFKHCGNSNCNVRVRFKCKKCSKEYQSYNGLVSHILSKCNFQGYYYQCPECSFQSIVRHGVESHVRKTHPNARKKTIQIITCENGQSYRRKIWECPYRCANCDRSFKRKSFFLAHRRLHCSKAIVSTVCTSNETNTTETKEDSSQTPNSYGLLVKEMCARYCSNCDEEKTFWEDDRLLCPGKCSNCDAQRVLKCLKCNHEARTSQNMINHLKTKCVSGKKYKCSKCEYTNAMPNNVLFHFKNVHEATAVECFRCHNIMKNKRTLTSHLIYCKKKPNLFCSFKKCSFKTNNPSSLRSHSVTHLASDNSECPKCGKTFKNRITMRSHFHATCKPKLAFYCDNCPYVTKYKKDLQTHMLKRHLRKINNDYEVCPNCGVAFTNKRFSRGHLRLCGTSKPRAECKYCYYMHESKVFVRLHSENVHIKEMENDGSYKEEQTIVGKT